MITATLTPIALPIRKIGVNPLGVLKIIVLTIHVLLSVGLITVVLLQSGYSAGLSGAIAGGAQQIWGKKKGIDELLGRLSGWMAAGFMVTALLLSIVFY